MVRQSAPYNVLLVDDDPAILRAMALHIRRERSPWRCVVVASGEAALVELAGSDYDAIVSDLNMPWMTGDQLLRFVRVTYPAVARIILSGDAERSDVKDVAHAFLGKPCSPMDVIEAIERVCTSLAPR